MTKSDIITRMALEAEGSELLTAVAEVIAGKSGDKKNEKLLRLKEVSQILSIDATWLRRLQVHTRCAIPLGGGKRYRLDDVVAYLSSESCRERVQELKREKEYNRERIKN